MKTATVTWITYNNFGTVLQAYSLQQFLHNHGIDNVVIDDYYVLSDGQKRKEEVACLLFYDYLPYLKKNFFHPRKLLRKYYKIVKEAKDKYKYRFFYQYNDECKRFKRENIVIKEMDSNGPKGLNHFYDVFIAGSDQTWSTLRHNFRGYYYLDFATKKKISYAASIGANDIPDDKKEEIKAWLSSFSNISSREKQTAQQLRALTGKDVRWVCDPTLLHDCNFWKGLYINPKIKKRPYVLCYFLENRKWYMQFAEDLAKDFNLQIILMPSLKEYCQNRYVYRGVASPEKFISLIMDSSYILTDSYHGMLFSLIFNKQFLVYRRFSDTAENCQNIRIDSMLEYLDLKEVNISEKKYEKTDCIVLDYERIDKKLNELRKTSREYLLKGLTSEDSK